jgi:class 3 adenylate cyclase
LSSFLKNSKIRDQSEKENDEYGKGAKPGDNVVNGEISFLSSGNYCVLFVDMMDSTKTTCRIPDSLGLRRYYSLFFSRIAPIVRKYGGKIIKTTGDGLIAYFPNTLDISNQDAFRAVIQCALAMTDARCALNSDLNEMGLPSMTYRVSADYGNLQMASSSTSRVEDLFGSTMNVCAKINRLAASNGVVIGGDLYTIIRSFAILDDECHCQELGSYDLGLKNRYPVYAITAKTIGRSADALSSITYATHHDNVGEHIPISYNHNRPSSSNNSSVPRGSHINLMIVDDEPDILLVYKDMLNSERYNPDLFVDPRQALEHYTKVGPSYYDLVILDIRMPRMNGLELYRRLRSIDPNVNVLFLTALDAAEELCSVLPGDLSRSNIIQKPLGVNQLLQRIELLTSIRKTTS